MAFFFFFAFRTKTTVDNLVVKLVEFICALII